MTFKRTLRRGMSGSDVFYMKKKLFAAGYYAPAVSAVTHSTFGNDTLLAVRAFQRVNLDGEGRRLATDGIIGKKTWDAVLRASSFERDADIPETIGALAAAAVTPALLRADPVRRALVLDALAFAFDPAVPARYPYSLYIRGGNLYNSDLTQNVITPSRIDAGAKRQPQYYDGGRKEMMIAAVQNDPDVTGADCSGGIVGLMRVLGLCKPAFDATADMLCGNAHSADVAKKSLRPGDWAGRPQHIGLYVGGGYVVEWMGGEYGCQLSKLDDRRGFNFVSRKMQRRAAWTRFRRPHAY